MERAREEPGVYGGGSIDCRTLASVRARQKRNVKDFPFSDANLPDL